MDLAPGKKREAVGRLATKLLSRDPVEFNAAINSSFTRDVVYRGHGLEIRGAANLKHAAWFWNTIDAGKAATFSLNDIAWDEQTQTAVVRTQRYIRPRLWPFFGLAIEVPVRLQLQSTGGEAYVARFEEMWPTERVLTHVPVVQAVHEALIKTIWTLIIMTLSNVLFAAFARLSSLRTNSSQPAIDRVRRSLPAEVADGIGSGFQRGSHLANGYGNLAVDLIEKVAYPPIRLAEASAQYFTLTAQRIVPFSLPYPYVYDAHALPSRQTSRTFQETQESSPHAPIQAQEEQTPAVDGEEAVNAAHVEVGKNVDGPNGVPQKKSVRIDARIATEAQDAPAKISETKSESLFDKLRKEGQDPLAEAAAVAEKTLQTTPTNGNGQQGSSGDEEGVKEGHKGGAAKKRNKKKKKNGGGGSHANGANGHDLSSTTTATS